MTTARTAGLIGAVVATALVVAVAMQGFAASQTTASATAKPKTITVTSTATVSTSPDIAVFDVAVRGESADASQAFDLAARKVAGVFRAVREAGVAQKDLTTLSVGLHRQVIDRGQPSERTVFVASHRVEVVVRDLDEVGAVLDAAVAGGAEAINDIRFEIGDPNAAQTDALAEAVARSRTKADAMAEAAGSQVTGLLTVTEGRSRAPFVREANTAFLAADAGFDTRIVPPNQLDTKVTVTVVWSVS